MTAQTPGATPVPAPLNPPPMAVRTARVAGMAPATAFTPTQFAPATPTVIFTATPTAATPIAATVVLLPTVTPTPLRPTPTPSPNTAPAAPNTLWPATYRVQGTFDSQTRYPDGAVNNQQGSFAILHQSAANAYGDNQAYSLSATRPDGLIDTSAVFLVDDYIAVTLTEGDWMVLRRDQGSSLVKAIQPITDLAAVLAAAADRADTVGVETRDGQPTRHIRLTGGSALARELVQPVLGLSGDIRTLTLDAWIVVAPTGRDAGPNVYVARYEFQVEIADARVFDDQRQEVLADQTVSWTYQLLDINAPLTIGWPDDAPLPGVVDVPGFARGEFPVPSQTEVISVIDGIPALMSLQTEDELAAFYRTQLTTLGWVVEGDTGLLRCHKGEDAFQLLISADPAAGGTRVNILPAP